jgi:tetratricopeptide (TPR) repeat protein
MSPNRPSNLAAYESWLRGAKHHEQETPGALVDARRWYEAALALDPNYARAHAGLAEIAFIETVFAGWGTEEADNFEQAYDRARKAVDLDPTDARPHYVIAMILMARHEWDAALRHWNLSAELDPNDADAAMARATGIAYLGQPDEAYATAQVAMRLNPRYPNWYVSDLGVIRFAQRKYRECLDCYGRILDLYPHSPAWKAAAAAYLGLDSDARQHAESFLANAEKAWAGSATAGPRDYVAWFVRHVPIKLDADRDHLIEGLRKAGLPA